MQMLTEKELTLQLTIIAMQKRLIKRGRIVRSLLRLSCINASDEEFQKALDAIVAGKIATREIGKNGAEHYVSTIQVAAVVGVTRG